MTRAARGGHRALSIVLKGHRSFVSRILHLDTDPCAHGLQKSNSETKTFAFGPIRAPGLSPSSLCTPSPSTLPLYTNVTSYPPLLTSPPNLPLYTGLTSNPPTHTHTHHPHLPTPTLPAAVFHRPSLACLRAFFPQTLKQFTSLSNAHTRHGEIMVAHLPERFPSPAIPVHKSVLHHSTRGTSAARPPPLHIKL